MSDWRKTNPNNPKIIEITLKNSNNQIAIETLITQVTPITIKKTRNPLISIQASQPENSNNSTLISLIALK